MSCGLSEEAGDVACLTAAFMIKVSCCRLQPRSGHYFAISTKVLIGGSSTNYFAVKQCTCLRVVQS